MASPSRSEPVNRYKMKMKEIRGLEGEELTKQVQEYRHELMNLRFQHRTLCCEDFVGGCRLSFAFVCEIFCIDVKVCKYARNLSENRGNVCLKVDGFVVFCLRFFCTRSEQKQ